MSDSTGSSGTDILGGMPLMQHEEQQAQQEKKRKASLKIVRDFPNFELKASKRRRQRRLATVTDNFI